MEFNDQYVTFSFTCKVSDENVAGDILGMLGNVLPYMADNVQVHDVEIEDEESQR